MNVSDDLAFERIVNTPKRGLGDATLQQLHAYGRAERVPLLVAARRLCETDELKPKVRQTLRALTESFARWARLVESQPHSEVAQTILEESGYTEMWQKDRSADAAGRLENLKEFVRSMEEFPDMAAFLEHVSLVMEASEAEGAERVSLMTLHAAKGLEFDTVFLPGWEDGLFPNQRALDESGRAGLEEERRLAHVGLTRARKRAKLSFAVNRRIHGLWSSTIPSRFIDELPAASVDVVEARPITRRAPRASTATRSRSDRATARPVGSGQERTQERSNANSGGRGFGASRPAGRLLRPTADRGRADRQIDGHAFGLQRGPAGVPHQVRPRQRRGGGRQQAHGRLRQGGAQDGAGKLRPACLSVAAGTRRGGKLRLFLAEGGNRHPRVTPGEQICRAADFGASVASSAPFRVRNDLLSTGNLRRPGTSMSDKNWLVEMLVNSRST